ncbi:M20 family peptidase [Kineococcus sp. NUM-3379]
MTGDGDDDEAAVGRLRALLRFRTVSTADPAATDLAQFDALLAALPVLYPRAHGVLERRLLAGRTALYRWPGRREGDPAVLMAHYDVVPAGEDGWEHPPFAGEVAGEGEARAVWGRGAIDMKGVLGALLEAADRLAAEGFRPRHDVYLDVGHDEEIAGNGAPAVVADLRERGIRPRLVLDEGGAVVEGVLPGVQVPMAVVGVAEKGSATVVLRAREPGGHAAMPPRTTATARLARAVVRLDRHPHPARMSAPLRQMLRTVAPHSRQPYRWAYEHLHLTGVPLAWGLGRRGDVGGAFVRTTQAVTQLRGSPAPNVLPEEAAAVVNVRVLPGSGVAGAVRHLTRAVRDPGVSVEVVQASEPSPLSPAHGEAWETLGAAIAAAYPGVPVVPYVMLQASDSRHFSAVSGHVYRFMPFDLTAAERATLHAPGERIRVSTYHRAVGFYTDLLRRL